MSLSYPFTLPNDRLFISQRWTRRANVGISRSPYTGATQVYVWPGQWWEVDCALPPIKDPTLARKWSAFFTGLNGVEGTFSMGDGVVRKPVDYVDPTTVLTVGSGATMGQSELPLSSVFVREGDWLQIGNSLYKVIRPVPSTYVQVWPKLRASYAAGTVVTWINAKGLFRLADDSQGEWDVDAAGVHGFRFKAKEAI